MKNIAVVLFVIAGSIVPAYADTVTYYNDYAMWQAAVAAASGTEHMLDITPANLALADEHATAPPLASPLQPSTLSYAAGAFAQPFPVTIYAGVTVAPFYLSNTVSGYPETAITVTTTDIDSIYIDLPQSSTNVFGFGVTVVNNDNLHFQEDLRLYNRDGILVDGALIPLGTGFIGAVADFDISFMQIIEVSDSDNVAYDNFTFASGPLPSPIPAPLAIFTAPMLAMLWARRREI